LKNFATLVKTIQNFTKLGNTFFFTKQYKQLHSTFTELKNAFQSYKEEIAPFIYEINTVNTIQDILPNLIYSTNGNLDLLEDTLSLNDTLFLDYIEGSVLVYKESA
jgi:hypothetical protein